MKKTLKSFALLIMLIVSTLVQSAAQSSIAKNYTVPGNLALSLSVTQEGVLLNNENPERLNPRILRDFKNRFVGKNAAWYESGDDFVAKFKGDSINTVVGYAKKGRWMYTIKHYQEEQLRKEIRHIIKSEYYDDRIEQIDEVLTPKNREAVYLIHLISNAREHRILRYSEAGIETVKFFKE